MTAVLVLSLLVLSGPAEARAGQGQPVAHFFFPVPWPDGRTAPPMPLPFEDGPRVVEEVSPPPEPSPPPPSLPFSRRPTNNAVGVFIPTGKIGAYPPVPTVLAGHSDSLTLTFDDCGTADQMEAVVLALAAIQRLGVFFITGQCRDHYPWLVNELKAGGHLVCNHTYSHPDLRRLSDSSIRTEIGAGIFAGCPYFRPPYGSWDGPRGRIARIAAEYGLTPLMWDVDSRDWAGAPADRIASTALGRGGVILLHLHGVNTAAAVRLLG